MEFVYLQTEKIIDYILMLILPDMLASRGKSEPILPAADGSVHYWLPPSDMARPTFIDQARQAAAKLRTEESNRLLYVAMTRARRP